jgi:hypothetical protein
MNMISSIWSSVRKIGFLKPETESDVVKRLLALDEQRVKTIETLMALDTKRVSTVNDLMSRFHTMDGMCIAGRSHNFLRDPDFIAAWNASCAANTEGWPAGVPDVRWRAHLALWTARQCLHLTGDFVECGVHTGLLSLVLCHALDFSAQKRTFYLFDTFNGIPAEITEDAEQARVDVANAEVYRDVFAIAKRNFAPFPNAILVPGILPASLCDVPLGPIAYLSVDLNSVNAERGVIEALWDRLVPGAMVLIDDYDWISCELQRDMWDAFAGQHGLFIATLPTGQGLLIKR